MVLALHIYCGDNVKYGLFSKHLLIWRLKKYQSNGKLLEKKTIFQLSNGNNETSCTLTYTVEKKKFAF